MRHFHCLALVTIGILSSSLVSQVWCQASTPENATTISIYSLNTTQLQFTCQVSTKSDGKSSLMAQCQYPPVRTNRHRKSCFNKGRIEHNQCYSIQSSCSSCKAYCTERVNEGEVEIKCWCMFNRENPQFCYLYKH